MVSSNQNKKTSNSELLRVAIAGSVDDGKSTLLGRIMFDSKTLLDDVLESVSENSKNKGLSYLDLSIITDGLKEERAQGITIDVAYRYFATDKRKFILADTPGHLEYTRNMVTGASLANAVIIMIDATKGLLEQTYRHSFIASLLQIPHLVICINKMDLVDYNQQVFESLMDSYLAFAAKLDVQDIHFIPVSALQGDNIVHRSTNFNWYNGATLMHTLENMYIASDYNHIDARFPIQTVIRDSNSDFRGFAGRISGGVFRKGDSVIVLPTERLSTISDIYFNESSVEKAFVSMSVVMTLADDIDIGRGCIIAKPNNMPRATQEVDTMFCWLSEKPMQEGEYLVQHVSGTSSCTFLEVVYKQDIRTLTKSFDDKQIEMNDIFRARIRTSNPLLIDNYRKNRITGSLILIDNENNTIAAGMIV